MNAPTYINQYLSAYEICEISPRSDRDAAVIARNTFVNKAFVEKLNSNIKENPRKYICPFPNLVLTILLCYFNRINMVYT